VKPTASQRIPTSKPTSSGPGRSSCCSNAAPYDATLRPGANKFVAGHVFEAIVPNQLEYSMLSGFFAPKDLETDLSGDDLEGTPRSGLNSGVFGVRIDDVNNDGRNEIWAGDASGCRATSRRSSSITRC
jgi:hypothetical protein